MSTKHNRNKDRQIATTPQLALLATLLTLNACASEGSDSTRSTDARGNDVRNQGTDVLGGGSDGGNRSPDSQADRLDGATDFLARTDLGTGGSDSQVQGAETGTVKSDAVVADVPQITPDAVPATDLVVGTSDTSSPKLDSGGSFETAPQPDTQRNGTDTLSPPRLDTNA